MKTNDVVSEQVPAQKMTIGWKFRIYKEGNYTVSVATTKALISFTFTVKLISAFVFANADCWFSHDAAQLSNSLFAILSAKYDYD